MTAKRSNCRAGRGMLRPYLMFFVLLQLNICRLAQTLGKLTPEVHGEHREEDREKLFLKSRSLALSSVNSVCFVVNYPIYLVAAVPRCVLLAADPFGRLEYSDRSVRSRSGGKQRCGRL